MSTSIIPSSTSALAESNPMQDALKLLKNSIASSSERQYFHTYNRWLDWADSNGLSVFDLSASHVIDFLNASHLARSTRQARLTHLRRLAEALHTGDILNTQFEQNYKQLQMLKLKQDTGDNGEPRKKRERKALAPDEVFEAMRHWPTDTNLGKRNRALLAVLFYAGLRRSEAVAMQWEHIDFKNGLLTLPHRKHHDDDKVDVIPFAKDKALTFLRTWRECIPNYVYCFPSVNKGDNIQADKPIATETVRRICAATGDFKPHDARRTLITNAILDGTPIPDVQYIAGHANPATTMHYAIVKDAKAVKGRIKLSY